MDYNFSALPMTRISSRYEERKFPLHTLTLLSGHSRETTREYYNDGKRLHAPSYTVWQYTMSGRGKILKNRTANDILPGSLMILAVPGDEVYYLPENSDYWEFVFITMVGRESFRVIQTVESRKGNIIPAEEIPKTMGLLHDLIFKLFSQTITNPYDNSTHSYALCMALLDETTASEKTGELFTFEELLVFLNENIHRDITIDEMAGLMRRSRSHFTRLFTGNTGISPRQYLEDLRLRSAISLLMNENINIKETAAMVGIRDENYFCRLFKKRYGLSPGKFKNRKYWQ